MTKQQKIDFLEQLLADIHDELANAHDAVLNETSNIALLGTSIGIAMGLAQSRKAVVE